VQTRWNDPRFTTSLESLVWTASPVVRKYLHTLVSGDPNCDWLTYVEWRHLPARVDRALVIGCGSGWLERALAQRGRFGAIVACDFAADSVARAQAQAQESALSSIEYRVVDLEREPLGGPYGAIFANDVLHHIRNVEDLYSRIGDALEPGGKLIFNEYIGPNRFQYGEGQMELVNRYFRLFPDYLRFDHVTGQLLWKRERPSPEKVEEEDPTEAVRSEEVLPLARRFFQTEKEYPYGGGLLNPLLFGVVANFKADNPYANQLLEVLCSAEDRLIRDGSLQPDFAVFVGGRPQ
jgi:SAM-dependent methyltransferase